MTLCIWMVQFGLQWSLCVLTLLDESVCRGGGHPWAWGLGGIMGHVGWWCRAVSCRWRWQRCCRVCSWVHMISQRATGRCAHGSGWPHWWGSCVALPSWSHGLRLLWVWVVATRRHSRRRRRCCLCRGQPRARARAGRMRRGMGWRTSHWRPGQQWLAWRSWVRSEWWARLVGANGGDRLVRPRRVQPRAWGCSSFGLHWIVGRLVSHAVADSWRLLQANWILWWTWKRDDEKYRHVRESTSWSLNNSYPKQDTDLVLSYLTRAIIEYVFKVVAFKSSKAKPLASQMKPVMLQSPCLRLLFAIQVSLN